MVVSPNYIFHPKTTDSFINHVELQDYFSPPECEEIIKIGMAAESEEGSITTQKTLDSSIRNSKIGWIECKQENEWLWHKLGNIANIANDKYYNFDLLGFKECAQFTMYDSEGSHYGWHMDYGTGSMSVRKLSIVVQLTPPENYEGGELQFLYGNYPTIAMKTLGNVIVFPSYTMHRVMPIKSGVRYSLVIWVSGSTSYR